MAESDKVFAGSIPKFYDTLMVPLWEARGLPARLVIRPPVCCRVAWPRLGTRGHRLAPSARGVIV
jgi:hypothetical protein